MNIKQFIQSIIQQNQREPELSPPKMHKILHMIKQKQHQNWILNLNAPLVAQTKQGNLKEKKTNGFFFFFWLRVLDEKIEAVIKST